jgi:galactokinase
LRLHFSTGSPENKYVGNRKSKITNLKSKIYRAPGRVNLIGEHTDYNDGFVMPAAIGFSTWVTSAPRDDRTVSVFSENFSERIVFDLDDRTLAALGHWSDYVKGVAITLERAGHRLRGAELRIRGEVPIGSGLSSSAALEVASGYALVTNSGLMVDRMELAKLCQRAENEFVGMRCGIMDQFVSCHGQAGKTLLLDCRSLEYKVLPLPEDARLAICNTMVQHSLASSEYNTRRLECEAAVHHFAQIRPNVRALRDVTEVDLKLYGNDLSEVIRSRARHVITENARVLKAGAALEVGDLEAFGQLMNSSHRSLRDDYEVSCQELDLMVELALQLQGVYGARMTGGGFGGCTVNLIRAENVDEFSEAVAQGYEKATGLAPEIYVCRAAEGVEEIFDL